MNLNKLWLWIKRRWLFLLIFVLVIFPGLSFILASGTLLAYTYWPISYPKLAMPSINPNAQHIVLIAHGLRDTNATWSTPLKKIMEEKNSGQTSISQFIALDWNPYSSTTFRCSIDGKRIGALLGEAMSASSQLQSVHLIGHSCGSFVIFGLCESLKEKRQTISIQTTYLDPVSIYGGLFWDYGIDNFGRCADFSEAYIDHDDTIPGSNQLLPNTHTFDVTEAKYAIDFMQSPHVWPTYYYQQLVSTGSYPSLKDNKQLSTKYPRGKLEIIKSAPQ
jgi:hypothetical protein